MSPARSYSVAVAVVLLALPAFAKVYLSLDKALEVAFGERARIERETRFLTEEQVARARDLAGGGVAVDSALVTRYVGFRNGERVGTAYFDTHPVRTLQETLMIVVASDGTVARVEVVAFGEPEEYLPQKRWYDQFAGRALDADLEVRRGIHGITGATLSARAATDAVRRTLAIHRALEEGEVGP